MTSKLKFVISILFPLFLLGTSSYSKEFGSMYSDTTLKYWQERYQKGVTVNYTEVILPKLTPEERRKLTNVRFEFPLFSADKNHLPKKNRNFV